MQATLKQIKQKLQGILKRWNWKFESTSSAANSTYIISGLISTRQIINELNAIGLFESLLIDVNNSIIFTTAKDSVSVQFSEGNTLNSRMEMLRTLLGNFPICCRWSLTNGVVFEVCLYS